MDKVNGKWNMRMSTSQLYLKIDDPGAIKGVNPLRMYMNKTGYEAEDLSAASGIQRNLIDEFIKNDTIPGKGMLSIMDVVMKRPVGSFSKDYQNWQNNLN